MSVSKDDGEWVVECDFPGCSECLTLDADVYDFEDVNLYRKENGWAARKEGREWLHYCREHSIIRRGL